MIKIVVAEDQPLILKDLCRKIEKSDPAVEIVATATNGETAYKQVLESKPDILLTDIKMPLLSGLELIRRLREEKLEIRTVIISGYKDFEFAREAMKLEVDEYLLKPLSSDDIGCVIRSLREKIRMKQEDYTQQMLERLIRSGSSHSPQMNPLLPFGSYQLMLVTLGSFSIFPMDYAVAQEPMEDILQVMDAAGFYLRPDERVYLCPGKSCNEGIYVFCLNGSQSQELKNMGQAMIQKAREASLTSTICLSRPIRHVDNIGIESQILRTYTRNHQVFGASSLLQAAPVDPGQLKIPLVEEDLLKFRYYVQSKNINKFQSELLLLLDLLEEKKATQRSVEACVKTLFKDCFSSRPGMDYDLEIDEYVTYSKSYGDLYSYLRFFSHQLFHNASLSNSNGDPEQLAESIQEYMEQHYSHSININEIAAAFSLTPAYLSRLFKKYTGKKPIEHLTSIRINHACHYFSTTDLPVKTVTELCGYSDQFYFSRAFKAVTGMSPSEYRIAHSRP